MPPGRAGAPRAPGGRCALCSAPAAAGMVTENYVDVRMAAAAVMPPCRAEGQARSVLGTAPASGALSRPVLARSVSG
jgi:hypothetical protein